MVKFIALSFILTAVSCGSSAQVEQKPPASTPEVSRSETAAESNVIRVVEEYMGHLSEGSLERSKALFKPIPRLPERSEPRLPGNVGVEVPGTLDWTAYLHERRFRLGKILSAKVAGDKGQVNADLHLADAKDLTQEAVFYLTRQEGQWFISDFDFVLPNEKQDRTSKAKGVAGS